MQTLSYFQACILCKQPIGTTKQSSKFTEKGCQYIANASTLKGEDDPPSAGDIVYVGCRRKFVHPREIQKGIQCQNATLAATFPEDVQLRSKGEFNFEKYCLYCTQSSKVDERKRGIDVMKGTLLSECRNRNDAWGRDVMARLECCNDLTAVEAVYQCQYQSWTSVATSICNCKEPQNSQKTTPIKTLIGNQASRRVFEEKRR